jgi:hypothetical protein
MKTLEWKNGRLLQHQNLVRDNLLDLMGRLENWHEYCDRSRECNSIVRTNFNNVQFQIGVTWNRLDQKLRVELRRYSPLMTPTRRNHLVLGPHNEKVSDPYSLVGWNSCLSTHPSRYELAKPCVYHEVTKVVPVNQPTAKYAQGNSSKPDQPTKRNGHGVTSHPPHQINHVLVRHRLR